MQTTSTFLIIADDLTGAADTAARCHHAGWPATIAVTPPEPPLPVGALTVNTDSRHLAPAEAAARVTTVCAPLVRTVDARADVIWYKKIDSTLRGNLGAELDALMALCRAPAAVVCPAFPGQGRGLEQGYLVHAGAVRHDLHLPTLLRHQSTHAVGTLTLDEVRRDVPGLAAAMGTLVAAGNAVLVADAMVEDDLDAILAAAAAAVPGALFCGSAGLMGALARAHTPPVAPVSPDETMARLFSRILVVVGSGSAMAHAQVRTLTAQPDVGHVIIGANGPPPAMDPAARAAVTVMHLPPPAPHAELDGPTARALAAQLADAAQADVADHRPDLLMLVGGDTAISLLSRLGVTRLEVMRELQPGIPLTRTLLPDGTDLHVVLKAGNHGRAETLHELRDLLLA